MCPLLILSATKKSSFNYFLPFYHFSLFPSPPSSPIILLLSNLSFYTFPFPPSYSPSSSSFPLLLLLHLLLLLLLLLLFPLFLRWSCSTSFTIQSRMDGTQRFYFCHSSVARTWLSSNSVIRWYVRKSYCSAKIALINFSIVIQLLLLLVITIWIVCKYSFYIFLYTVGIGFHRIWNIDKDCLGEMALPNLLERMKTNVVKVRKGHCQIWEREERGRERWGEKNWEREREFEKEREREKNKIKDIETEGWRKGVLVL